MKGRAMRVGLAIGYGTLALAPVAADAQSYQCRVPATIPRPRPDLPSASQPQRLRPIGSYTLALSWAPQYCHNNARDTAAKFQCRSGNRFGFTLHGLWPDGVGKEWPQYCTTTTLLPPALLKQHLCATPSVQLLQHEWAKHGTCMGITPTAYFEQSTALYAKLRYPDMNALSRQPLNAGQLAVAFAAVNPAIPANAVRVTVNRRGWLDELWLCLDKRFAYTRCEAGSGGVADTVSVKIWRGKR